MTEQEFMDIAAMDYIHYCMEMILKKAKKPISPICQMIDKASGFSRDKEDIKSIKSLAKQMIKLKNRNGIDTSPEKELLAELKKITL